MRIPISASRFCRSVRGTAGIEFAFALPLLLVMLLFGLQIITYVNAVRKVELLASSISEMISQATPATGSTTAYVNELDLHFAYDSALVLFPYLMGDSVRQSVSWYQDITIDFSSVQFTKIAGTTCSTTGDQSSCYLATVAWTSTGTYGTNKRVCSVPQLAMNDTAAPNKLTLPRSIFGAGSVVVIDIVFNFHPVFASNLMPTTRIARSVYVQPRYASLINYDTTNSDGIATKCTGF